MYEVEIDKNVYLPCYHHILDDGDDIDIELIWGGRDSGKSKFVAQWLTELSMSEDYFRCILIKQTHESIKDSQWQMIKDTIEEWELDELFEFRVSPLSIGVINSNRFLARGMDKPGKIRSITNPSHAWVEEANQISEEAFVTLLTGLRTNHGKVKLVLTFNPEAETSDFEDFWIYRYFFSKYPGQLNFKGSIDIKIAEDKVVSLKYRSTHTTYKNNPFVTPQRIAFHESLEVSNPYWYKVYTLGMWGNKQNDSPWAYAFNADRHIAKQEIKPLRTQYLWLSFDFNRNPACCSVIQLYNSTVYVIETIKLPKSGTDALCEYILTYYPNYTYMVTGDYSGNNASSIFREQITNYTVIKRMLRLVDSQLRLVPNPRLEKNSMLVNYILAYYNVQLCPLKAKALRFDLEKVKRRADGTILKEDRDDPAQQADALDTFRYFCNINLGWVIKAVETGELQLKAA